MYTWRLERPECVRLFSPYKYTIRDVQLPWSDIQNWLLYPQDPVSPQSPAGMSTQLIHIHTRFTRPPLLPVFSLRKQCQVLLNLGRGFLQISSHCLNPDRSAFILLRSVVSKLSIPYIREGLLICGSLGCHNLLKVTVNVWHRCVDNAVAVDPNLSFLCTHEGRWYDPDNSAGCVCKPGYTHTPDACVGKCWRFLISYPWWRFV